MLGENIRRLRRERGLRQEELGRCVGASKQSVSNWENGNIMPSIDMLERLADSFGVSTDLLLGRDAKRTLDASGLTDSQAAHIQQIIDDLRGNKEAH